jgi:glyoxylase-like metal-dependent hydrolase (beta-lactamase superfamily II)
MIDSGSGIGGEQILENIREDGIKPEDIRSLILTHCHADHACGASFFRERLKVEVIASRIDAQLIEKGTDEELGLGTAKGPIYPYDYRYTHSKVDRMVDDEEEIKLGDKALRSIIVPGHTPGAMCIFAPKERILFTGDVVFINGTIGLGNWPGSDLTTYRTNIGKLSGLGVEQLFPGHYTFTLREGQVHLDKAVANLKLPWVPPVWGHNHPAV